MKASIVRPFAHRAFEALAPFCDRIEIAGSLRRGVDDVKDIEIVCIPRTRDLYGWNRAVNQWRPVKGQTSGKHTQRIVDPALGLKLDLFMCTPSTWACNMLIRTGCKDFSHSIATHALRMNRRFIDAQLWTTAANGRDEEPTPVSVIPVLEEEEVFEALALPYIDAHRRIAPINVLLGRRKYS